MNIVTFCCTDMQYCFGSCLHCPSHKNALGFPRQNDFVAKVDGVEYPLVGDVYSAEADSLQGTLYYDSLSEEKGLTKNQKKDRFESFRDKNALGFPRQNDFVAK